MAKRKGSRYYRKGSSEDKSRGFDNLGDDFKKVMDDVKDSVSDKGFKGNIGGKGIKLPHWFDKWKKKMEKSNRLNLILILLAVLVGLFILSRIGIPLVMLILLFVILYLILF